MTKRPWNYNKVEVKCAHCGTTVLRSPSQLKAKNHFCCSECHDKWRFKIIDGIRVCKQCGETRPIEEFPLKRKQGIEYRTHLCGECFNAKRRAARATKSTWQPMEKPYLDEALGVMVKKCKECSQVQPLSEFYYVSTTGRYHPKCKSCKSQAFTERYAGNPTIFRERAKRWARNHPDKIKAKRVALKERDPEAMRSYWRKSHIRNRDKRREYDRQKRNRPGYYKRFYERQRSNLIDAQLRRRARKNNALVVEKIDRQAIIERDNSTCYLCGKLLADDKITLDHVIPLARGGTHTADNLRVACSPCNSRKGVRLLEEMGEH